MSEKRITPEEVAEAYRKIGLLPGRYDIIPRNGFCCGLGAMTIASGGDGGQFGYDWVEAEYGNEYVSGFLLGFDAVAPYRVAGGHPRRQLGFDDGWAARQRAVKEFVS